MVKFRHKNFGGTIIRINDSKSRTYYLGPGEEVVIDKSSPRDTVKVIEEIRSLIVTKKKEEKKIEYDLNNDGVFDKKDLSIAGRVLSKSRRKKGDDKK